MKDVEKTDVDRQNSGKRMRRRRRKFNVYAFVVLLLVATAGITISYTFLFNISEIRVSGESDMYTAEEIVEASGIREGDNLLRLDPEKSEQAILDKLLFVESADVQRDFPSSLEITVTRCEPAFNVSYDGGTLLVSKKGKILADNGFVTDGLPIIYGFEPAYSTPGKPLESKNSHKNDAFSALITSLERESDEQIAYVDMSDEFSINVTYKNGLIFHMGNWNDTEYKLKLAENVMSDESVKGKKGYLTMIGTNVCGFRPNKETATQEMTTSPAEQTTDIYGRVVEGEKNPEQKAIFEHYNNNNGDDNSGDGQQSGNSGGIDYNNGGYGGNDYNSGNDYNYGGNGYDPNVYNNDAGYDYGNDYNDNGYDGGYAEDYGQYY